MGRRVRRDGGESKVGSGRAHRPIKAAIQKRDAQKRAGKIHHNHPSTRNVRSIWAVAASTSLRFQANNKTREGRQHRSGCAISVHQLAGRPDKDASGPAIVRCSHPAFGHGAFNAVLDRLMMQAEPAPGRKKRWILSIRQQDPRPLNPARRFRSRLRYRPQLCRMRIFERQLDRPPPRRHGVQPLVPKPLTLCRGLMRQMNPSFVTTSMEAIV
jgi:hypothetical protein